MLAPFSLSHFFLVADVCIAFSELSFPFCSPLVLRPRWGNSRAERVTAFHQGCSQPRAAIQGSQYSHRCSCWTGALFLLFSSQSDRERLVGPECGFAFIYSIDRELYLGASTPPGVAAIDFQSRAFSWHLIKLQLHVQEGAAGTTDRFHIPIYVGPMHLCQPIPCVWSEEYARLVGLWRKTAPRPTENVGE